MSKLKDRILRQELSKYEALNANPGSNHEERKERKKENNNAETPSFFVEKIFQKRIRHF
jgi:hypothetical protein